MNRMGVNIYQINMYVTLSKNWNMVTVDVNAKSDLIEVLVKKDARGIPVHLIGSLIKHVKLVRI